MQKSSSPTIYRPGGTKMIPLTPLKSKDSPTGVISGIALGIGGFFVLLALVLTFTVSPFFLIIPGVFPGSILAGLGFWIRNRKNAGDTDKLVLDREGVRIHSEDKRIALSWEHIRRLGLSPDGTQFQIRFKKNTYSVAFHRMDEANKEFLERVIIDFDQKINSEEF